MKSTILTLVLLLGMVAPALATPSAITSNSVHLTGVDNSNGDEVACSGVVVGDLGKPGWSLVLTARHCTEDGVQMENVYFFDGDVGQVEAYAQDDTDDLAILAVHSSRNHGTERYFLSSDELYRNEKLIVFGNSGEFTWNEMDAFVMNPAEQAVNDPDHPWQHITFLGCTGCAEGTSGAGVWTMDDQLAGVVVAGASGGVTAIEGAPRILLFLQKLGAGKIVIQPNN